MSEKKISKLEKMARDGAFKDQFGGDWFVKIKPAYGVNGQGIDKVIFSFVKKDTAGKEFFDIYMDIDAFDNWADEIIGGSMKAVLSAEAAAGEKYPKEYKYITGANGEKSVGFMLGRTGAPLINASIKEEGKKAVYANVPLTYGWLKTVAKQFKRTSAPRFAELDAILMEAANKYRHEVSEEEYVGTPADSADVPVPDNTVKETKAVVEESVPVPRSIEKYTGTAWWCINKGSKIETRKDVPVITALVKKLSDTESDGILETDPNWQFVELVFFPKNVERAKFEEEFNKMCEGVNSRDAFQLPKLTYSIGDVRDGKRQLIFQSA